MDFRRRLIVMISADLGIILVLFLIIIFIGADVKGRAGQVINLREELSSQNQRAETLASLRQDSATAQRYTVDLGNALPSRDQLLNFSPDLNIVANQNKVNAKSSLGSEERNPDDNFAATSFTLTLDGELNGVIGFLKTLSISRYPVKLISLDLVKAQANTFTASINGKVFSF